MSVRGRGSVQYAKQNYATQGTLSAGRILLLPFAHRSFLQRIR